MKNGHGAARRHFEGNTLVQTAAFDRDAIKVAIRSLNQGSPRIAAVRAVEVVEDFEIPRRRDAEDRSFPV